MLTQDAKAGKKPREWSTAPKVAVTKSIGEEVALRREALDAYKMEALKEAADAAGMTFNSRGTKKELVTHLAGTATNEQYETMVAALQAEITDAAE